MVTYYNKKDLLSFGKYLLSKERTKNITDSTPEGIDISERLKEVYHADIENWKMSGYPITDLEIIALGFTPFIDENTGAQQFKNDCLSAKIFINEDRTDITIERYGESIKIFDLHDLKKNLSQ